MSHSDETRLPDNVTHPLAKEWAASRVRDGEKSTEVKTALEYVAGQAANHLKQSAEDRKDLPLNFFYTLFAFTNLVHQHVS